MPDATPIAAQIERALGVSGRAAARLVDEDPTAWWQAVNDRRDPSFRKVAGWCQRAGLVVTINPDGTLTVRRPEAP